MTDLRNQLNAVAPVTGYHVPGQRCVAADHCSLSKAQHNPLLIPDRDSACHIRADMVPLNQVEGIGDSVAYNRDSFA